MTLRVAAYAGPRPTDSTMGHAHLVGCDEARVQGVCSSAEEGLMDSLMSLHGDVAV